MAISGLLLALLIVPLSGSGSKFFGRKLGGDFTEFYGAGKIVLSGRLDKLYDRNEQTSAQKDIVLERDAFVPFAYPPQMALFYSLFSMIPFQASYLLHTFLMIAALVYSLYLLQGIGFYRSIYFEFVLAAMLFYYPIFRAVLGGQNTPITILLLSASYAALRAEKQVLAGIYLGLLLYKPQLSIVLLCLLLLIGKWRTFSAGVVIGLLFYVIDCYYFGQDWIARWYSYANWVVSTSMAMEGEKAISWIGFLRNAYGIDTPAVLVSGYVLAGMTTAVLALLWLFQTGRSSFRNLYGLAAPGLILISPHTYYYDAGILMFSAFAVYYLEGKHRIGFLSLVWSLGMLQVFSKQLHFSPVFFSVLICFIGMVFVAVHPNKKTIEVAT
jgi:hypothetical protein